MDKLEIDEQTKTLTAEKRLLESQRGRVKQLRSVIAVYPGHINRVKESKIEMAGLPAVKDCDRRITSIVLELRQLERDRAAIGDQERDRDRSALDGGRNGTEV
jgi:hypothetical protein